MPKQAKPLIQSRMQTWKKKKKKDEKTVTFSAQQHPKDEKTFYINKIIKDHVDLKNYSTEDIISSLYSALSGSGNEDYNGLFVSQAVAAMMNPNPDENTASSTMNAFQGGMISMNPQDITESQLCSKLMILHSKSMHFMNRATNSNFQKNIDQNLNNAVKCMRLHNETLEALNRYRRKGEQRVKVVHQYVQVNEGGQAVVAGEVPRGRGNKKSKGVPHANQFES